MRCLYQRASWLTYSQSQSKAAAGRHQRVMGWMMQVLHQKVTDSMQEQHQMVMEWEQSGQIPMMEVERCLQKVMGWKWEQLVVQSQTIVVAAV